MKKQALLAAVVLMGVFLTAVFCSECFAEDTASLDSQPTETRYHFVLFWKHQDTATDLARQNLKTFAAQGQRELIVSDVRVGDPARQDLVNKYGVSRAPMPLVLAIAPNGAVTEAIMSPIDGTKLTKAIVSPGAADCLKGVQDRKIVFVCVRDEQIDAGEMALEGVRQFATDDNYREATRIVQIAPTDTQEVEFLQQLKIDPGTTSPVTVMVAPSGGMLGKYAGATKKAEFVQALSASQSGCCPGGKCEAGGCCPAE